MKATVPSSEEIAQAYDKVRQFFPPSPLTFSPIVSELLDREIYFKWDNKLRTGSFKERGAINFLLSLSSKERKQGVCAASAGNHALALSLYARKLKIPCSIVMPEFAPLVKVQWSKQFGAEVILQGNTFDDAYSFAKSLARKQRRTFVPPFDHPLIIAGQASCGLEIIEQLPDLDQVIVPVGGGGLISGIALAMKSYNKKIQVTGVRSEWVTKVAQHSKLLPNVTIADGIAVKTIGEITGKIIKSKVDQLVAVSEDQIARGIIALLEYERTVVEGAGAAAFAALLARRVPRCRGKIVVLACGSNIDMNLISRLIERDMGQHDRLLRVRIAVPDRPGSLSALTRVLAELRANVLEVLHDRSFSKTPGSVDVQFILEVRNSAHKRQIMQELQRVGFSAQAEN